MREILFRGKRVDNGEWVYGDYRLQNDEDNERVNYMKTYITPRNLSNRYEIIHETVGQYTGLIDKNGVKIFEGDKCCFSVFDYNDCDEQYTGVVVWSGSRYMLWNTSNNEYYGNDGGFDLDWVVCQDDEFEVIGNVHDNRELLKQDRLN